MANARVSDNKKKIGRPATGVGQLVGVRLSSEELDQLDNWIADNAPGITRPEGMRRMLQLAVKP